MKSPARALFRLLRTDSKVPDFTRGEWEHLLAFADRTHMTLFLRSTPNLPHYVADHVARCFQRNARRRRLLWEAFEEVQDSFVRGGVPLVLLKGFTHEQGFGVDAGSRVQCDLDFLVEPPHTAQAQSALRDLGYRPHGRAGLSAEHGRPWVRPFDWTWKGDYFDPHMPIPVELHDSLWSPSHDRLDCAGLEDFSHRSEPMNIGGHAVPALAEADRIAFAALHSLRHILRNDARPSHAFELARLLETRASDRDLWERSSELHPLALRQLQTIAFRFAQEWFGCALPRAIPTLPARLDSWLAAFAWSPIDNLTSPNKDVLWLHTALLKSRRERWNVVKDRLLPLRLPHTEEDAPYRARLRDRLRYHAFALLPALKDGAAWWWSRRSSSTVSQRSD
jgi:hypothetical protein